MNSIIKTFTKPKAAMFRILVNIFFLTFLITVIASAQDSFTPYSAEVEESIEMVPVEGGTIILSPEDDNSQQVEVEVDSFWMGKYEITWDQYKQFSADVMDNLREQDLPGKEFGVDADGISLPSPPYVDMSFGMGTDGYPAISMTHYAASMFAKWLTAKTGDYYRLPTEAEWEYACRAGLNSQSSETKERAWFKENSENGYQKVGTKEPNEFGIHDLLGNVAEWTTDQFQEDYHSRIAESGAEPVSNPWIKPTELYPRTVRGASWMDEEDEVSCTKRRGSQARWKMLDPQMPKSRWWLTNAQFLGFRVVRPLDAPAPKEMEEYWPEPIEDY